MKKLWIMILITVMILSGTFATVTEAKSLESYSTKAYNWGLGLNKKHKIPSGATPKSWDLAKDKTYYYGAHSKKNKVVYLTFDCGYENGYTGKILDTLKKNNIKAIFFVTEPYIKSNPKLVKRMKKEGHLVGNHTCSHPRMAGLSVNKIKSEITNCEKTMRKKTGYEMDKFIRPPEGNFSKRSIKVTKSLGYTTILWSLAYYDYDTKNQPGKKYVLNKFKTYHHNGMIPLIHTVSKSNCQALPEVITYLKKKGYRFGTIGEFAGKKAAATTAAKIVTTAKATTAKPATTTAKATTAKPATTAVKATTATKVYPDEAVEPPVSTTATKATTAAKATTAKQIDKDVESMVK